MPNGHATLPVEAGKPIAAELQRQVGSSATLTIERALSSTGKTAASAFYTRREAHGLLHREIMRSAGLPIGGRHRDFARSGTRRYGRLHVTAAPVHERRGRSTIE